MRSGIALGLVLVGAGVLWLLSAADVVDLAPRVWIGVVLIGIGLAIALTPGRHRALVILGLLVALAGVPVLAVGDEVFEGGIGASTESPRSSTDLEPFRHGIGKLTVDLTEPDLPLDEATIEASLGIGELVVLVPEGTDIALDAHVGVGNAEGLGQTENGVDVDLSGISGTSGRQEVTLELDVGVGNLRIVTR